MREAREDVTRFGSSSLDAPARRQSAWSPNRPSAGAERPPVDTHSTSHESATQQKKRRPESRLGVHARTLLSEAARRGPGMRVMKSIHRRQPHFESPQLRQVMQPSIITTAAVLHLPQSCAPSG